MIIRKEHKWAAVAWYIGGLMGLGAVAEPHIFIPITIGIYLIAGYILLIGKDYAIVVFGLNEMCAKCQRDVPVKNSLYCIECGTPKKMEETTHG